MSLRIERFWIALGIAFLLGGLGTLFQVPWPLVPVLLILFGVAVLSGDLTGRHLMKK